MRGGGGRYNVILGGPPGGIAYGISPKVQKEGQGARHRKIVKIIGEFQKFRT